MQRTGHEHETYSIAQGCVKAYIDDPRPMSEKIGEEIEKELENLK